ncbi:hypothetical protein [Actinomadura nitritigenes]|uniref:hypothetical protein n=1 Tax=Actinomadura nitritigenes TaxID=134602 RepID=UPI003D933B08
MPPATKTPSSGSGNPGTALEVRIARLWFWEGYYSRRGVDLQQYYGEPLAVTDIDLLAYDFGPRLARTKFIGEAKSGTGKNAPKPLDRVIWLRGLRELVNANAAELVTAVKPSMKVRRLASSLGVTAQSLEDIERREQEARIREVEAVGPHGVNALGHEERARKVCKADPELERAYWFLRAGVWFVDPFMATKQLVTVFRQLSKRWTPDVEDEDMFALRWLMSEALSVFGLNLATLVGMALPHSRQSFGTLFEERLSEGALPVHQMRALSEKIDDYIMGVLSAAKVSVPIRVDAMGAFQPQLPDFGPPLLELIDRMTAAPAQVRLFCRQLDVVAYEHLVQQREISPRASTRLGLSRPDAGILFRYLAAFLRSQTNTPQAVEQALHLTSNSERTNPVRSGVLPEPPPVSDASGQQSLLDGPEGSPES